MKRWLRRSRICTITICLTVEKSINKLWNNLNMVCFFKKNKTKTLISKIVTDSKEFTDPVDVMNSIVTFAMLVKNL